MKIGALLGALKAAGLDASFDDLRAMLWLADHMPVGPKGPGSAREAPSPAALDEKAKRDQAASKPPAGGKPEEPLRSIQTPAEEAEAVQLFGDKGGAGRPASPVRVRGAPALAQQLALGRALRPLLRRRAGNGLVMDEQASAELVAETGVPALVYRPVRERWFDLVLVSEQMATMAAWQPVLAEFERLLRRLGGFRSVRSLELDASGEVPILLHRDGRRIAPKTLHDRNGRALVLVLSDCTSVAWHDGRMGTWLESLASDVPVSVAQYLPQPLWPNTAVGFAELQVRAPVLAPATRKLQVRRPSWAAGEPGVAMPVFALTPAMLGGWARMMAGSGDAWSAAALLPLLGQDADAALDAQPADTPSAEQRMRQFRAFAGRDALLLAAYCSAVRPLTPPVMRVIHRALAPESGTTALAQVLLGGILYPLAAPEQVRRKPDEVEYEFYPGLRDALSVMLTERDAIRVNLALHEYLVQLSGTPFDFFALMADTGGTQKLPEAALPFARFARQHFDRLAGGRGGARGHSRVRVSALRITARPSGFLFTYSDGSTTRSWKGESGHIPEREAEMVAARLAMAQMRGTAARLLGTIVPHELVQVLESDATEGFCELILDRRSMHYPWELFLGDAGSAEPLPRRRGLTRRLISTPRVQQRADLDPAALVIGLSAQERSRGLGDADFDDGMMSALRHLVGGDVQVADRKGAVDALTMRPWRIVHLVDLAPANGASQVTGGPAHAGEIAFLMKMFDAGGCTPELVFIDHVQALDLAHALVDRGVSVVIAAPRQSSGFEKLFAETLYKHLHAGESLIESVRAARRAAPDNPGMVAVGVECYGEPDWRFARTGAAAPGATTVAVPPGPPDAGRPRPLRLLFTGVNEEVGWLAYQLRKIFDGNPGIRLDFLPRYATSEEVEKAFRGDWPNLDDWDAVLCVVGAEHEASQPHEESDRYAMPAQETVYAEAARQGKRMVCFMRMPEPGEQGDGWTWRDPASVAFAERVNREQIIRRSETRLELVDQVSRCVYELYEEFGEHGTLKPGVAQAPMPSDDVAAPRETWVLVAGTGTKNAPSKKFIATCTLLGERLARYGFKLMTGGWKGADESVARGFAEELDRLALPVEDRLLHVLAKGRTPAFKRGRVLAVAKGAEYAECTSRAGYLVVLGGHGGTAAVAQQAFDTDCLVLPLANTGGEARRIHERIRALEPAKRQRYMSDALLEALADQAPAAGASVVKMIMDLERLRTDASGTLDESRPA
jgi:hypothetical protein